MGNALVSLDVTDGVATLRLDDPDHRNALTFEMSEAIAAAVASVRDARVIVLTAAPPVFCSGGNLDDLLQPKAPLSEVYSGYLALSRCTVPTICAVGGAAIGAGVNLALACDVVICSDSARFDPRFLDIGIHPGGGHLWRLSARVGPQGAAALSLFGDSLTGTEAAAAGLAWRCVPDSDLDSTVDRLARRVVSRGADLVERTKATLVATRSVADADAAFALELEAQEWSVAQPHFAATVEKVRQSLLARSR